MRADATFTVQDWTQTELVPTPAVALATPVSVSTMTKVFAGTVAGQSSTIFTSAFDQQNGVGTYVAIEAFSGDVDGRSGTFAFAHSATTTGADRTAPFFVIVPGSGTGQLAGISGGGDVVVDADGIHRLRLDYEIHE